MESRLYVKRAFHTAAAYPVRRPRRDSTAFEITDAMIEAGCRQTSTMPTTRDRPGSPSLALLFALFLKVRGHLVRDLVDASSRFAGKGRSFYKLL